MQRLPAIASLAVLLVGCGAPAAPEAEAPGARVAIAVAPLDLPAVGNVVYQLTVQNGAIPPETVWTRTVDADTHGDGAGSLSYVGPCDASTPTNAVSVEVLHVYTASGAEITDFMNPGPVRRDATCAPDRDTAVAFDLTLARAANQGFFDVAVSFDDIFCSAKLDCVDALLFNTEGKRDTTVVVAFACTTGAGTATFLHLDTLKVSCSDGTETEVLPTAGPGNTNQSGPHVYQVASYRGEEHLAPYEKCYWNTAIGLDLGSFGEGSTTSCTLTAQATASQADWPEGRPPAGTVWPWIKWSVPIVSAGALACTEHALNVPGSNVTTEYVQPDDADVSFAATMECASCASGACVAELHGVACSGSLPGVAGPVIFRETAAGVVVAMGGVESAPMPLPSGYALTGCCANPCCAL